MFEDLNNDLMRGALLLGLTKNVNAPAWCVYISVSTFAPGFSFRTY